MAALFSPIPNRDKDALPTFTQHPFGPDEQGVSQKSHHAGSKGLIYVRKTLVSVQTVMAFHALEISFPLEYQPPNWKNKPINFISHLVGHEGPGSLHSYLKRKHWVTSLSTGPQNLARGFAMYKITIHLTPEGFGRVSFFSASSFTYNFGSKLPFSHSSGI